MDSLRDMLVHVPVGDAALADLQARMAGSDRHYHNTAHLALLWERHRALGAGTPMHDPEIERLIACAIAFHDAIYDATRRDSETLSAELWRSYAEAAALPRDTVDWVHGTICATADHLAYKSERDDVMGQARQWMLDLDLTPIGETPALFARNTQLLRAENGHLDDASWDRGRLAFLAKLGLHAPLYRSAAIADVFEAQAHENIRNELAKG